MNIGFIGSGQMAQALGAGIAQELSRAGQSVTFHIHDPSPQSNGAFIQRTGESATVVSVSSNSEVVTTSSIVFVAVKPQRIPDALESTKEAFTSNSEAILISVAAGVTIDELQHFTGAESIVRVMPNTPCLIGRGAIGLAANDGVDDSQLDTVTTLLSSVGTVQNVSEDNMDAVTGLSGSGPAYVFTFIEALVDGGVLNGLSRATALSLALETVFGAAELVRQTGEHTSVLRDRVTSPGGTTIAGLKALEETGFRDSVMSAVTAATERSRELGG